MRINYDTIFNQSRGSLSVAEVESRNIEMWFKRIKSYCIHGMNQAIDESVEDIHK